MSVRIDKLGKSKKYFPWFLRKSYLEYNDEKKRILLVLVVSNLYKYIKFAHWFIIDLFKRGNKC